MKKVFVDTAAWLALLNVDDSWHLQAKEIRLQLAKQNYIFVTTEFILLEVADALCSTNTRKKTANFLRNLYHLKSTQIIPFSQNLLQLGLDLYEQRLDKNWGLTDCISFVIMHREKIQEAFTSDKHFEQAGFTRLIKKESAY